MNARLFMLALLAALCVSHLCAAQDSVAESSGGSDAADDEFTKRLEVNPKRNQYSAAVLAQITRLNEASKKFVVSVTSIKTLFNTTRDLVEAADDNMALALRSNERARAAAANAAAQAGKFKSKRANNERDKVASAAARAGTQFGLLQAALQKAKNAQKKAEASQEKAEKWYEDVKEIVRQFNVKDEVSPADETSATTHADNVVGFLANAQNEETVATRTKEEATEYTTSVATAKASTEAAANEADSIYQEMLADSFSDDGAATLTFASNVALLFCVIAATVASVC